MIRSCALVFAVLLPSAAAAQTLSQDVPRPGTFNDASAPLKQAADGPPRALIRLQAADVSKPVLFAANADRKIP